jgi:hypothetical protein
VPPQVNVIGTFIFAGGVLVSLLLAGVRTLSNRRAQADLEASSSPS